MCRVIAIANQKGGVGKTTTTMNLGVGLALQEFNVLLIDADPQGSLTVSCGFKPGELDETLTDILNNLINNYGVEAGDGIVSHDEGFDLMPSNISLASVEVTLINISSREAVLRHYIDIMREHYDYILIDCPPSLGMLTINALTCADSVLIPTQPSKLAVEGLQGLLTTISMIRDKSNHKLGIEGVLFTMVRTKTRFPHELMELVQRTYGENVHFFHTSIPLSIRAEEAPADGKSVIFYSPKDIASQRYLELTSEIVYITAVA